MTTYNLTSLVNGTTSVVEPLVADTEEKAVAFAAGLLTERVKGHEAMFMSPGVRWAVDTAVMDLASVTMLTGDVIGMFDLVIREGQPKLVWTKA
jgi:hypothetical protein